MRERVKAGTKAPEAKMENSVVQVRKSDFSHSINPPVDHAYFPRRTLGDQTARGSFISDVIQPKLTISQPNDRYEQEADRIADQIMRAPQEVPLGYMPESAVQAKPT